MSNTFKDKAWRKYKRGVAPLPKTFRYKGRSNGSPIAGCNCALCKYGRKHGWGEAQIERFVAGHKAEVKRRLAAGD